jgi:predicted aconitase with swiveling domain
MINLRSEPIVAVGAIISGIPLVDRVPETALQLKSGILVEVDADRGLVRILGPTSLERRHLGSDRSAPECPR